MVGYALCFGSVLAKMCRIYYIFHNRTAKKIVSVRFDLSSDNTKAIDRP